MCLLLFFSVYESLVVMLRQAVKYCYDCKKTALEI